MKAASSDEHDQSAPVIDRDLFRRVWVFVRPHRRLLFVSLLLLPIAAVLQIAPAFLLKLAIDNAIVARALAELPLYALLLVATLLLQQLAAFGQSLTIQLCGQRAMHDLRTTAHRHVLGLRVAYFDRTPVGGVMTRVTNDVESIAEAFAGGLISVLADAITLIGIVIAMLLLDARLALLTFSVLPVLLVVVLTFQRALRVAYRLIRQRLSAINATLAEQLGGIRVVQIFARQQRAEAEFEQANAAYRDGYRRSIKLDSALFALVEMLGTLTIALLLWYGGLQVASADSTVTFGLLVAFIEYVRRFFIPIRDLSAKYAVMQQAMAAAERVFSLLDLDEPDCPASQSQSQKPRDNAAGAVLFRDVTFGYDENEPVIKSLSLQVSRGENVALVGTTGAGKTTIARLLTRLYELNAGEIQLDGVDIRDLDPNELRRRVVVLSQDVFLFAGTVRSNIVLDDPRLSDEAVRQAAERIGLLALLDLDHQVLERGANLSAGERQLVVFARALVRDPEVLILDEATANVDPASEKLIQQGIAELMRERTAIVIAHRLSTIERVESVYVLSNGRILEQGSPAELLASDGIYARLHELQYI